MTASDYYDYPSATRYLAERLPEINEERLRDAKNRGEIAFIPIGRKVWFLEVDLDKYVEMIRQRRVEATAHDRNHRV